MKRGSVIRVTIDGSSVVGVIDSATNWGTNDAPNWYIQYHRSDNMMPCYYKQALDGGTLELLS
jgi:hypothetical protein